MILIGRFEFPCRFRFFFLFFCFHFNQRLHFDRMLFYGHHHHINNSNNDNRSRIENCRTELVRNLSVFVAPSLTVSLGFYACNFEIQDHKLIKHSIINVNTIISMNSDKIHTIAKNKNKITAARGKPHRTTNTKDGYNPCA